MSGGPGTPSSGREPTLAGVADLIWRWLELARDNNLDRVTIGGSAAYWELVHKALLEAVPAEKGARLLATEPEARVALGAAACIDVWCGGDRSWRTAEDGGPSAEFMAGADWEMAVRLTRAVLGAAGSPSPPEGVREAFARLRSVEAEEGRMREEDRLLDHFVMVNRAIDEARREAFRWCQDLASGTAPVQGTRPQTSPAESAQDAASRVLDRIETDAVVKGAYDRELSPYLTWADFDILREALPTQPSQEP